LFQPPTVDMLAKPAGGIGQAMSLLRAYLDVYDPADGHEAWEAKVRAMADAAGVKAKGLFMAIRVATTGSEQTPPLYDILNVLGGEEVRRRLRLALEALAAAQTPATSG
jgi:glutamyl-tRNA synthetase